MDYSTVDIREFLMDAFSDEELNTLCFDHFVDVYNGFTAGQTKGQRVQLLLEYCLQHNTLSQFISILQRARPEQFAKRFPNGVTSISPESQPADESPDEKVNRLTAQAQELLRQRRFEGAVTLVRQWRASYAGHPVFNETYSEVLYQSGVHWYVEGSLPKARQAFREVIELDPFYKDAASNLRDVERRLLTPPVPAQRQAAPVYSRRSRLPEAAAVIGLLACVVAWLVVPEVRHFLGLDGPPVIITPAASQAFTCTDQLGCIDIGPNDPIHIAYLFVTSGDNSTLGLDTKYGAELAVDDAGGKVLGHDIHFDGQDSQCTAEGGQAAGTKIAADKTVVAVIGTNCSSAARAAIPIVVQQAGLTMISPSNTAPDLTDPANHVYGYLRTAYNDKAQGAVAAQFVFNQLKLKRAATVHDGSIYAQSLAGAFADSFTKLGGTITAQETVNVGDKDMKPALTRIASGKPDLIYYPIFIAEGGLICSQIRDVAGLEKTGMMGADGLFSPDFLKACGEDSVGMLFSSPNFSAFGSGYQDLVAKYLKKYNVKGTLGPFHAHSYDAVMMILKGLKDVTIQDADGTLHIPKQALRDALAATDMQGITGHIKCDANGDCADPKIAIYQVSQDDFANDVLPKGPIWMPGGPDYRP